MNGKKEEGGGRVGAALGGGRRGEEREQLFTRADQEYSTFLGDESGRRRGYSQTSCGGSALSAGGCTRLISGPSD